MKIQVFYEATPNPHSMKFVIDRSISEESVNFEDPASSERSPLARKIFGFPWAGGVFLGPNFVTVTKQDWVDWDVLAAPLSDLIAEHIGSGEPILLAASEGGESEGPNAILDSDPEDVKRIKEILNQEVRPAVAMDGGDIVFNKYEDQILYLYMQGACAGCPSSTMTLKMGIETRMKEALPDLKEVVSV